MWAAKTRATGDVDADLVDLVTGEAQAMLAHLGELHAAAGQPTAAEAELRDLDELRNELHDGMAELAEQIVDLDPEHHLDLESIAANLERLLDILERPEADALEIYVEATAELLASL